MWFNNGDTKAYYTGLEFRVQGDLVSGLRIMWILRLNIPVIGVINSHSVS